MNTPGGNTISTAELSFAMLLALARKLPQAHLSMVNGQWDRKQFSGVELAGTGAATVLTGKPNDENSLQEPTKVAPVTTKLDGVKADFSHAFPAQSVTILRLKTK
jgi:alpha-L-arabinofuranosidase